MLHFSASKAAIVVHDNVVVFYAHVLLLNFPKITEIPLKEKNLPAYIPYISIIDVDENTRSYVLQSLNSAAICLQVNSIAYINFSPAFSFWNRYYMDIFAAVFNQKTP